MSGTGNVVERKGQNADQRPFSSRPSKQVALDSSARTTLKTTAAGSRQPFAVKNSMPLNALDTNIAEQNSAPPIKRDNSPTPYPSISNRTSQHLSHHVQQKHTSASKSLYAAHAPSPLSISHQHEQKAPFARADGSTTDVGQNSTRASMAKKQVEKEIGPSLNDIKTPRKRAIPLEDVHCRNAVALNPHKRSRGSSTATGGTSTSSISAAINEVHIRSQGGERESETLVIHQGVDEAVAEPANNVEEESTSTSKTVRIDKQSRLSQSDRMQRDQRKLLSTFEWRKKFLRAFPSFRFYLDGYDTNIKTQVEATIISLGGHIEPFFSKAVTHLVTARKVAIPGLPSGESVISNPQAHSERKTEGPNHPTVTSAFRSTLTSASSLPRPSRVANLRGKKSNVVPLHSERNPFDEWLPPVPANDILTKARAFDIKIWTHEKFVSVTTGLTSPSVQGSAAGNSETVRAQQLQQVQQMLSQKAKEQHAKSLSQLLEKEKVQGIHERDARSARPDYYYFSRNAIYVLVEDATGDHRPVMAQEWRRPAREDEEIPWPVLYGELEGRCPFTKFALEGDPRKRMKPNRHESLRRSVSLNHVRTQQRNVSLSPAPSNDSRGGYCIARGASPYPLASGNSMSVASTNITSTTSAAAPYGNSLGLLSPFHPLARKTAPIGIGIGRPSSVTYRQADARPSAARKPEQGSVVRKMLGLPDVSRTTSSVAKQVPLALPARLLEQHAGMRRSVSTPTVVAEIDEKRTREKHPGYCENCRVKYDDFDDHVQCRRHRKFATDASNFADIDELLRRVTRPIATWALDSSSDVQSDGNIDAVSGNSSTSELDEHWTSHLDPSHLMGGGDMQDDVSLADIVQHWQKDADRATEEDEQDDPELDEVRKRINAAAAAFRFRTGLEQDRSIEGVLYNDAGEPTVENLSTSSPNAASYGLTNVQAFDNESITSASPQSSQAAASHPFEASAKHAES